MPESDEPSVKIGQLREPLCYEPVACRSACVLSTVAPKSALILVIAMVLNARMGYFQAQALPRLEPQADPAVSPLTGRVTAREPPGVLPAGSGGRAGSRGDSYPAPA